MGSFPILCTLLYPCEYLFRVMLAEFGYVTLPQPIGVGFEPVAPCLLAHACEIAGDHGESSIRVSRPNIHIEHFAPMLRYLSVRYRILKTQSRVSLPLQSRRSDMRLVLRFTVLVVALVVLAQAFATADVKSLVKQLASPNYVQQMGAEVELWSYGPESTPIVVQMLKDKDPKIRAAAAQAIWHIRDRNAIPALKLALKDKDPKVKAKAKEVLEQFNPTRRDYFGLRVPRGKPQPKPSFDALVKILKDDDEDKRQRAMENLRDSKDPRLFDLAVSLIHDKNKWVSSGAVDILCEFTDGRSDQYILEAWRPGNTYFSETPCFQDYPRAAKLALVMIRDPNPQRREEAARILCDLKAPESVEAFREAMSDSSAEVRQYAADGLGKLGDTASSPILIKALADPSSEVSSNSAMSLGYLKAVEAVDPLIAAISDPDCDEDTKQWAAWSLGRIGERRAIPTLIECLKNRGERVKESAAGALGELKAKDTAPLIWPLLKDSDDMVKWVAAQALGEIGDPKAGDALVAALNDRDAYTVTSSMLALAKLNDRRAFSLLVKAASIWKPQVSVGAVRALGELGDKRALPYMLPYISASYVPYADEVMSGFAALKDPRAVKPIILAITKGWVESPGHFECACQMPDIGIAASSLMEMDLPEGNEFLMKALEDMNLRVIHGAARFYISQGLPDSEETLIKAMTYGDGEMYVAYDFIKSGNPKLVEAGRKCIAEHTGTDNQFPPNYVSDGPIWGSKVSVGRNPSDDDL